MDAIQKNPREAPCLCDEDEEIEVPVENKEEREKFHKVLYKMKKLVSSMYIREDNLVRLREIMEAFVSRAHRKRPYLSKNAQINLQDIQPLIALLFERPINKQTEPCVCTNITQVCAFIMMV